MPTTYPTSLYPAPTDVARRGVHNSAPQSQGPALKRTSGPRAARAHRLIARMLLGALAVQLFFAGLGVFGISSFLPHMILGTLIVLTSFALPLVAWRGHLDTALVRRSWLLAGLMVLQGLLIDAGHLAPAISALHPVNAMLLVLVTYSMARRES